MMDVTRPRPSEYDERKKNVKSIGVKALRSRATRGSESLQVILKPRCGGDSPVRTLLHGLPFSSQVGIKRRVERAMPASKEDRHALEKTG